MFERVKCKVCKTNFGAENREWLCSVCYKLKEEKKSQMEVDSIQKESELKKEEIISNKPIQENKFSCWSCDKKVGHLGFKCECNYIFCKSHRHFSDHNCDYDFKSKKIQQQSK